MSNLLFSPQVSMMDAISVLDPVKSRIIKFHGCFEHIGNTCLGFEMLESCLYGFLVQRDWVPLSVSEIRPIAQQVCDSSYAIIKQ